MSDETEVFTPLSEDGSRRLRFPWGDVVWIEGGLERREAGRELGICEIHGQRYVVYGAKCGLGCECDARIAAI